MLNRLLGATAIGVVFSMGLAVSPPAAQAQVQNPDDTCRDGEDESGATIDSALRCGEGAEATDNLATAIGKNAKANGRASIAIGPNARVNNNPDETVEASIAIGVNALVESLDDDPGTPDDEATSTEQAIAIGNNTRIRAGANNSVAIGNVAEIEQGAS